MTKKIVALGLLILASVVMAHCRGRGWTSPEFFAIYYGWMGFMIGLAFHPAVFRTSFTLALTLIVIEVLQRFVV